MDEVIPLDLAQVRATLVEERARIMHRLELLAEPEDDDSVGREISYNPDRSDLADEYAARERDLALLAIDQEQLAQIDAALQRLTEGTYGVCLTCGEPITPGRLEILPYATLCIRCQSRRPTH